MAYALDVGTYENWTDVSGVLEADPRIIPEARVIPRLTFKEIGERTNRSEDAAFMLHKRAKARLAKIVLGLRLGAGE